MDDIGTRKKRTVQEPIFEPRREPDPVQLPAPQKMPKRKKKVAS